MAEGNKTLSKKTPLIMNLLNKRKELVRLVNFVLIDIRVIFVIVSVYITVGTAIATTANNEAANDSIGNRTFDLTSRPEHSNLLVSDVSNSVLWNCREKSVTRGYYKALYGLLFTAFALILLIFIITRLSVVGGYLNQHYKQLRLILWHIQLVKWLKGQILVNGITEVTGKYAQDCSDHWDAHNDETLHVHWLILTVPYGVSIFTVLALPFMLTTYDIHPIGCLTGPDEDAIQYNNATGRVQLGFTETVLAYQKAALTISILLMIPIAVFIFLLLREYFTATNKMVERLNKIRH